MPLLVTMHVALKQLSPCVSLLPAVTHAVAASGAAASCRAHCHPDVSHSVQSWWQQSCSYWAPAAVVEPWHVLHSQQAKQQEQTSREQGKQQQLQEESKHQQQQPEQPSASTVAAGQQGGNQGHDQQQQRTKQQADEQEKQQQKQDSDEQDGPLEGPNGLLAEWRVESSRWWSKVFHMVVDNSLNYPQFVTWAELYQSKPPGLLKRIFVPEGGSNLTWPLAHMYRQHTLVAEFLLSQAHADFDPETFREGVKQAIEYSTQLYAASDWVTLKPLVSTALLQSMQHAWQQQASLMNADDVTLSDVELVIDPDSVRLVSASAITREQLSRLDQQRPGEALPLIPVGADNEESATVDAAASAAAAAAHSAAASPVAEGAADLAAWDVAHVYAEGVLRASVQKGDGPAKQVELFKRGHWVLGRGPVHLDRVLSAEVVDKTPWFLLSWL